MVQDIFIPDIMYALQVNTSGAMGLASVVKGNLGRLFLYRFT